MFHFASKGDYYLSAAFIQERPLIEHVYMHSTRTFVVPQHRLQSLLIFVIKITGLPCLGAKVDYLHVQIVHEKNKFCTCVQSHLQSVCLQNRKLGLLY